MLKRCKNPKFSKFENYGGRGIRVCERWGRFENFLLDMGPRPEGTSLDRIDNDGDYTPDNCRWATREEQGRNKRNNKFLTFRGQIKTQAEWAEFMGLSRRLLEKRMARGWTVERALTQAKAGLTHSPRLACHA
jgi:hypothetical protein